MVYKLLELPNKHPRVDILNPGPGVAGDMLISCRPCVFSGDYPGLTNLILTATSYKMIRMPRICI